MFFCLFLDCNDLTNVGVAGLEFLPKLSNLQMNYLSEVNDSGLRKLKNLVRLECRGCFMIQDDGLMCVIEGSPRLELLELTGCANVTNNTLECAVRATRLRQNNIVLRICVNGTEITVNKDKILPLLHIVNVL